MTGIKIIAAASTTGLLATAALPIDPWIRLVIDAPIYGILFWVLAKTIPKLSSDHRDGLSELAAEVKANGERTNQLLEKAFDNITESGCDVR